MPILSKIEQLIHQSSTGAGTSTVLKDIFGMLDFTTLEGTDHEGTIKAFCNRALAYRSDDSEWSSVAAICVYPVFAGLVRRSLAGSTIRTAVVAGGFPSGQMHLDLRLEEVARAIADGAEEIDMVISRGHMISGAEEQVRTEVRSFATLCRDKALLKVILETGELNSEDLIRRSARIALEEGADFIKTSTGKIQPGATLEAFYYMLDEIRNIYTQTGEQRGIKAAGGISEPETAIQYYMLTKAVLGESWLTKDLLRFGTSRLADKLWTLIRTS
jgi:deoxyribose-phosphate aldolase